MKRYLKQVCLGAAIASSASLAGAQSNEQAGSLCPDAPAKGSTTSTFAKLDPQQFAGCVAIGDRLNVLALQKGSPLSSTCAAEINRLDDHHDSACKPVREALMVDDLVRIDDVGGKLWLNIWRGDLHLVAGAPLTPTTVKINNVDYTIGYHTEVEFRRGTIPVTVSLRYDVYLEYRAIEASGGARTLEKYYAVEVFESGAACRNEIPEQMSPQLVECNGLPPVNRPQDGEGMGDGEQPSGGGGEPPPK